MQTAIELLTAYQFPLSLLLFVVIYLQVQKIKEELACINGKLTVLMMELDKHEREKETKRNQ